VRTLARGRCDAQGSREWHEVEKLKSQRCSFGRQLSLALPTRRMLMVSTTIRCLHNRIVSCCGGKARMGPLLVFREAGCAFFVYDDPPERMSFPGLPDRVGEGMCPLPGRVSHQKV